MVNVGSRYINTGGPASLHETINFPAESDELPPADVIPNLEEFNFSIVELSSEYLDSDDIDTQFEMSFTDAYWG